MIATILMAGLAATGGAKETVQVGTTAVTLSAPAGYCKPTSASDLAAAQLIAAADEANVTLATYVPCGSGDKLKAADYFLVKAPKSALLQTAKRAVLLAEVGKAMELPQFTKPDGSVNTKTEDNFEKMIGQRPQIEGAVLPLGSDDTCVYMGGVLSLATTNVAYKRAISACITTANGKVVSIYRYSEGATANVAKHLATVKAIARSQPE